MVKQRAWQKGAVPCSFWVLSEEVILSKRSVSLESCKSADLVKKKSLLLWQILPVTLQHVCGIPVMHCHECRENLSITNIHLHALVTSQSLEEKGFATLRLSHFILKNAVQFHLQNLFQ